ncbi:MAG: hypothetical protein Q7U60_09395, partial [Candidatus Methanoperedens sp.]|nr:hypothetical protein [Candidatus Methanoperedens sp.]
RADMPNKFAGAPWNYLEILLDKNHANIATFSKNPPPSFVKQTARGIRGGRKGGLRELYL